MVIIVGRNANPVRPFQAGGLGVAWVIRVVRVNPVNRTMMIALVFMFSFWHYL